MIIALLYSCHIYTVRSSCSILQFKFVFSYPQSSIYCFNSSLLAVVVNYLCSLFMALILFSFKHLIVYNLWYINKIILYIPCFTNIPCLTTDQKVLGPQKSNTMFQTQMEKKKFKLIL